MMEAKTGIKNLRVLVWARLELTAPLHIGSGRDDDPLTDQPVLRDVSGSPFIPGATLAGAFAAGLDPARRAAWLAQPREDDTADRVSPLVMDDARPPAGVRQRLLRPVEIRALNRLDRESLMVADRACFNLEVVPVGTPFVFACRCDFAGEMEDPETDGSLGAAAFIEAVGAFLARGGGLGARTGTGLGNWRCDEFFVRRLALDRVGDLRLWLSRLHGFTWEGDGAQLDEYGFERRATASCARNDARAWRLRFEIEIRDGLHLSAGASGLPEKEQPDLRQARRFRLGEKGALTGEPVDYGSTVRGRLRTAMEMLLRTHLRRMGRDPNEVKRLVPVDPAGFYRAPEKLQEFFGCVSGPGGRGRNRKSRWRVSEAAWEDAESGREDHIRLDEFTQQVISGAKFDFAPLTRGKAVIEMVIVDPAPWQQVLALHAARLLGLDILPWGGHAARGYLGARIRLLEHDDMKLDGRSEKEVLEELLAGFVQQDDGMAERKELQNG